MLLKFRFCPLLIAAELLQRIMDKNDVLSDKKTSRLLILKQLLDAEAKK